MSIALSEFWTRLVRGGIADAAACKRMANAFADANGSPALDVPTLAKFLVETNELTEFQSRCLLSANHVGIRFGDFVRRTDTVSVPLSHWLSVRTVNDRRDGFLIRVAANQFTENRRQWLEAHSAVVVPSLQPFELHGGAANEIVDVFSELPDGRCLFEIATQKMKVERRQALTVGIAVADALVAMHARSLVHGAVRADRIWLTTSGQTILLRDPSGPPAVPRQDQSAAWIDVMESPGAYAAPEFADPGFACNSLTDIYSLGCLLFRMIAGRLPFSGHTIDAEIAAHVSQVPMELSEAVGQGEAGDPVLRVIAYMMAKSPAARFSTAQQVSDALKAVLGMMDDGAASKSKIRAAIPQQEPPAKAESPAAAKPSEGVVVAPPTIDRPVASAEPTIGKRRQPEKPPEVKPRFVKPRAEKPSSVHPRPPAEKDKRTRPQPPPAESPALRIEPATADRSSRPPQAEPKRRPDKRPPAPQEPAKENAAAKQKETPNRKTQPRTPPQPPPAKPSAPSSPPDHVASPESTATPPPAPSRVSTDSANESPEKEASEERPARRRRRKKKSKIPFVFGILSVPVLLMVILLIVQGSGGEEKSKERKRPILPDRVPSVGQARNVPKVPDNPPSHDVAPSGYELVDDDRLLWVPPYAADSATASLELLPPGPGVIVTVRLAEMLADPVGRGMIEAFSPELSGLIKAAADRARVPQESIERCTVALHAGQEGWPLTSLAIELAEPLPLKTLADRWQATASRTPDGATVYAGDDPGGDVFFLGDSEKGALAGDAAVKRFALGPLEQIREVAANEGGVIPLPRLLDKVWSESSIESDFVALVTPNFLFADGRAMMQSTAPELVDPLKSVLIPDVAAMLISANAGQQDFYAEMRVVPSGDVSEARLLRKISDAFGSMPAWADMFVVDSVPDPSWRLLATRMPLMLRFLVDHTRFGVSDGTIVANAYLPANAATQITLAALLAMNTKPGSATVAVTASPSTKPLTVEEMLNRKMSVDFDQESLEFGINVIVDQFEAGLPEGSTMPKVRIVGGDLEKAGITQNQQIRDFSKQDLPLRTVLTDLLLGANPDKTATGPKDPKQALVWVVAKSENAPGGVEILVTTRAASAGLHELPAEFKPDE